MTPPNANSAPARSVDRLLGGRVTLVQPASGARAAIDPVLLAAAVPARSGETVLDVGCGSGAAALCLAARVAGVSVAGLDVQADLVALAGEGAALSGLAATTRFYAGDLLDPPPEIAEATFDHVMANPPHLRVGAGNLSPDPAKVLASVEGAADLARWVAFCAARTRPGGTVTFVHRADRRTEVAGAFAARGLATVVCPLWPRRHGAGARRVLVQGLVGADRGVRETAGLVLHASDGRFTPEVEAVLRDAAPLALG